MTGRPFWTRDDIAALLDVTPAAVTMKVRRAHEHLAEHGRPLAGDIPLPDGHVGSGPGAHWWRPERVRAWLDTLVLDGRTCGAETVRGVQCEAAATVLVDGVPLCSLHANRAAAGSVAS